MIAPNATHKSSSLNLMYDNPIMNICIYIRTIYSIGQAEMILMTVINSSLISYTDEIIRTILSSYHRAPFF